MASIHRLDGKRGATWRVRYRDPDGMMQSRSFKTNQEATDYAATTHLEVRGGTYVARKKGKTLYGERAAHVQRSWSQLAAKTAYDYESIYRTHVEPRFAERPIGTITRSDLQALIDDLLEAGLADSTVIKIMGVATAPIIDAATEGIIPKNVAHDLRMPKQVIEEADHLDGDELDRLLATIELDYRAVVAVQGYGGLRIGECSGLQWGDIDFATGLLYVRAGEPDAARARPSRRQGRAAAQRARTKTAAGKRVVPMLPELVAELEAHRARLGATPLPSRLVFSMPDGGPLNPNNYRKRVYQPAAIECGLGERVRVHGKLSYRGIGTHTLRHTAATTWLDGGASPVEVCEWLGHTDSGFTMRKYGHSRPRNAATVMANVQASIEQRRAEQ